MVSLYQFLSFVSLLFFTKEAFALEFKSCSAHGPESFAIESVKETLKGDYLCYEVTAWPLIDIPSASSYHVTVIVPPPATHPRAEPFLTEDLELTALIRDTSHPHHLYVNVPFTFDYCLPLSLWKKKSLPKPLQVRWEIVQSYTYAKACCVKVKTNSTNKKSKPKSPKKEKSFFQRMFG